MQERGDELWLAPFLPSEWLKNGKHLAVKNAPTRFGPVSYDIASLRDSGRVELHLTPPPRRLPERVVFRLRDPEGRAIRQILVNGREDGEIDPRQNTIRLKPGRGAATLVVQFQ